MPGPDWRGRQIPDKLSVTLSDIPIHPHRRLAMKRFFTSVGALALLALTASADETMSSVRLKIDGVT